MKVNLNLQIKMRFRDIERRQTFVHDKKAYLKIDTVLIKGDIAGGDIAGGEYNAVRLNDGSLVRFSPTAEATPHKMKLTSDEADGDE